MNLIFSLLLVFAIIAIATFISYYTQIGKKYPKSTPNEDIINELNQDDQNTPN